MSEPADVVREFTEALSPAARHHLDLTRAIPLIRAATEHTSPAELAHIVSAGIGWHTPANAAGLILFRLDREAHSHDDQEATL